jgi:hypothetical protein
VRCLRRWRWWWRRRRERRRRRCWRPWSLEGLWRRRRRRRFGRCPHLLRSPRSIRHLHAVW